MLEGNAAEQLQAAVNRFESARTRNDYVDCLAIVDRALPELSAASRSTAMLLKGRCLYALGSLVDAEHVLKSLGDELLASGTSPPGLLCETRIALANLLLKLERRPEAIDLFLACAHDFHEQSDVLSEAEAYRAVAILSQEAGDLDLALSSLESAKNILENTAERALLQGVLYALGHTYYLKDDLSRAIDLEEQALAIAHGLQDRTAELRLVHNLAEFSFTVQDFRRALKYVSTTLKTARESQNWDEIIRYLAYLGACYGETGAWRKALAVYDEVEQTLADRGSQGSVMYGAVRLGRAQVLVDMKRHDQARPILAEADALFVAHGADRGLLSRIQHQVERETSGPLRIDCAHRALQIALRGTTRGLSHANPRPIISSSDDRFVTSELSEEDRARLGKLAEELRDGIFQTKHFTPESGERAVPGGLVMPLRWVYVDDVAAFEIKWSAFKQERRRAETRAFIQKTWDEIKDRFAFEEGVFRGDKVALLEYIRKLAGIAQAYAEIGDEDGVCQVALHASDFVEIETDDPMIAAVMWPLRTRVFLAAHRVCASAKEPIEIELRRALTREQEVFDLLDNPRRDIALDSIVIETWYEVARDVLGREGYDHLVKLVGDRHDTLQPLEKICYGVAVGQSGDPVRGTQLIDSVMAALGTDNTPVRIPWDLECGRATVRYWAECPDWNACQDRFGPFAHYIHGEVRSWGGGVFADAVGDPPVLLGAQSIQAFVDENLAVMDNKVRGRAYGAAMLHESKHRLFRSGQMLKTADGRWLRVKRDVPTASAETYLYLLEHRADASAAALDPGIDQLCELGTSYARQDPRRAARCIANMLRYFDDLATQETPASYPCAAILIGMSYGLYGSGQHAQVHSYISHLAVMDHDEAFQFGKREATLRL